MNKLPLFFVVAVLALPLGIASSNAQSSSELIQIGSAEQYAVIKRLIKDNLDQSGESMTYVGEYNLLHCGGAPTVGEWTKPDDIIVPLANIAYDVITWTNDLNGMEYPAQAYERPLQEYEKAQLSDIMTPRKQQLQKSLDARKTAFMKRFATTLNAVRSAKSSLPKIVVEGACRADVGAGEVAVKIDTDPRGGTVFVIPQFFYELCRAQKLDPDDRTRCNRWREAFAGMVSRLSGDYRYLAMWPDGANRRGTLSVTDVVGDTIVLRKP